MENPFIGSDIATEKDHIQSINSINPPTKSVEQTTIKIIKSTQNGKSKYKRGNNTSIANITDNTNLGNPKTVKANK